MWGVASAVLDRQHISYRSLANVWPQEPSLRGVRSEKDYDKYRVSSGFRFMIFATAYNGSESNCSSMA